VRAVDIDAYSLLSSSHPIDAIILPLELVIPLTTRNDTANPSGAIQPPRLARNDRW